MDNLDYMALSANRRNSNVTNIVLTTPSHYEYRDNVQQYAFDIDRIARFGATLKYGHNPNMDKVVKLGQLDIEKKVMFYSYFKSYFCVLTEDGLLRYYRNRNDYYFDKYSKQLGFIPLQKQRTMLRCVGDDRIVISSGDNSWTLRFAAKEARITWYRVISKQFLNLESLRATIVSGYIRENVFQDVPEAIVHFISKNFTFNQFNSQ